CGGACTGVRTANAWPTCRNCSCPPTGPRAAPPSGPTRTPDRPSGRRGADVGGAKPPVHAAGALVWRVRAGELEVLLVHRPRYDDWSWPKGKLHKHESLPAAAVREVKEETGVEALLGVPLPTVRYRLSSGTRKV